MGKKFRTYVKNCADCGAPTLITDTRTQPDGTIFRVRYCPKCSYKFRTIEVEECLSDLTPLFDEIEELKKENKRLRVRMARAHEILENGGLENDC